MEKSVALFFDCAFGPDFEVHDFRSVGVVHDFRGVGSDKCREGYLGLQQTTGKVGGHVSLPQTLDVIKYPHVGHGSGGDLAEVMAVGILPKSIILKILSRGVRSPRWGAKNVQARLKYGTYGR